MGISQIIKFQFVGIISGIIVSCGTMNREKTILTVDINPVAASFFEEGGYSLGVSACYAGCIGQYLVMAGGCNFPTPGNKKYYDRIYIADTRLTKLEWKLAGHLPQPSAYGVTIQSGDSLIIAGGNNSTENLSSVYSIHIENGELVLKNLPSLPCTLDNAAATLCEGKVYIVGGNKDGKPSASILSMDLNNPKWVTETEMPGFPRVQPVCAAYSGKIYVWGGFYTDGANSRVACDGLSYDPSHKTYTVLKAPKNENDEDITLSGGTSIAYNGRGACKALILCAGGVNKDIFLDAISGNYKLVEKRNYLKKPIEWYKFNGNLQAYDPDDDTWSSLNHQDYSSLSRAGASMVDAGNRIYYIGGELKPSVRTPEIIGITLK